MGLPAHFRWDTPGGEAMIRNVLVAIDVDRDGTFCGDKCQHLELDSDVSYSRGWLGAEGCNLYDVGLTVETLAKDGVPVHVRRMRCEACCKASDVTDLVRQWIASMAKREEP